MDNQMLLLFIECGVLGVTALVIFFISCVTAGWKTRLYLADPHDKILGPALSASVAAGSITLLFFDGLSFAISAGLLFLVYGITGAALTVSLADRSEPALSATPRTPVRPAGPSISGEGLATGG